MSFILNISPLFNHYFVRVFTILTTMIVYSCPFDGSYISFCFTLHFTCIILHFTLNKIFYFTLLVYIKDFLLDFTFKTTYPNCLLISGSFLVTWRSVRYFWSVWPRVFSFSGFLFKLSRKYYSGHPVLVCLLTLGYYTSVFLLKISPLSVFKRNFLFEIFFGICQF